MLHEYHVILVKVKVKWSRYRPGVAQRVGRGIAVLFHDRGTRRGWVVSSTPPPHSTPGKDTVPILQEAGWALGPVWTGGKSRPHRDSIPYRSARSQSLYRLSYRAHTLYEYYVVYNVRNYPRFHVTAAGLRTYYPRIYRCPRRNVPDFGRVFLMLKYTDITQNTYIQSWTATEIMATEKWGLLAVPNTATCTADTSRDNAIVLDSGMQCSLCLRDALRSQPCYVTAGLSHV